RTITCTSTLRWSLAGGSRGKLTAVPSTRRSSTPPRVERTFAFVDLCGFTDYADNNGDDEGANVLHLLRASVREAATTHGARAVPGFHQPIELVSVDTSQDDAGRHRRGLGTALGKTVRRR